VKIAVVQGTRPEIIKNYSIVSALRRGRVPHAVFHTNQHSSGEMRDQIYAQMQYAPMHVLPAPYRLGTAINWLQSEYEAQQITHVVVNGDTAASVAGALSAMYSGIAISHVEAGLRAQDPQMLEERNRIMVDAMASLLFAYTEFERDVLEASADICGRVFVVGNTTVDILTDFADCLSAPPYPQRYLFATLHRREFTTSIDRMRLVFAALSEVAHKHCPVILPLHPRTRDAIERAALQDHLRALTVIAPLRPLESLSYQKHALAVVTDSGCVQEEAYLLGVPCVTIRENTERKLTVSNKANRITGFDRTRILDAVEWAATLKERSWPDIYGKPGVGDRIVACITEEVEATDHVWHRRRCARTLIQSTPPTSGPVSQERGAQRLGSRDRE
jgi:UDP-N-acetylglucosamine 2-epimerase